ncbi:4Fe-4S binding protein [Propioniciclava coleopterorum]|uniref:4Fe-4S binding protein n=1 Tax=Propioniciclava coleopterorum TaxID=2714937 RepID=A0A6G7Y7U9_9ACTN|nr:4Fe-4S dicluster domain-containing protein [Propioniciclava coleopterorum]QIK72892.1 4Fe-4S binding protein [Propioniciclava coleopterorum]
MGGGDQALIGTAPALDAQACTRPDGRACTACAAACPADAILLVGEREPRLDVDACTGCGACVPACPASAFSGAAITPVQLVARASGRRTTQVRCARAGAAEPRDRSESVAAVACLAGLDPEAVVAAAGRLARGDSPAENASRRVRGDSPDPAASGREGPEQPTVRFVHADCASCAGGAPALARRVMERTAALLATVDGRVRIAEETVEPATAPARTRRARGGFTRRGVFALRQTSALPEVSPDAPARALLRASYPQAPVPRVAVAASCTACEVCSLTCPTRALSWRSRDGVAELILDAEACTACGECARLCPEDVLTVTPDAAPPGPAIIARVAPGRCTRCRAVLAPGEGPRCTRCEAHASFAADIFGA